LSTLRLDDQVAENGLVSIQSGVSKPTFRGMKLTEIVLNELRYNLANTDDVWRLFTSCGPNTEKSYSEADALSKCISQELLEVEKLMFGEYDYPTSIDEKTIFNFLKMPHEKRDGQRITKWFAYAWVRKTKKESPILEHYGDGFRHKADIWCPLSKTWIECGTTNPAKAFASFCQKMPDFRAQVDGDRFWPIDLGYKTEWPVRDFVLVPFAELGKPEGGLRFRPSEKYSDAFKVYAEWRWELRKQRFLYERGIRGDKLPRATRPEEPGDLFSEFPFPA
jgi:hypothetical protein